MLLLRKKIMCADLHAACESGARSVVLTASPTHIVRLLFALKAEIKKGGFYYCGTFACAIKNQDTVQLLVTCA